MVQLFISKIDLAYAYGQTNLSEETNRQCVSAITGERLPVITGLNKVFTDLLIYRQYSKKKFTEHWNTLPQLG